MKGKNKHRTGKLSTGQPKEIRWFYIGSVITVLALVVVAGVWLSSKPSTAAPGEPVANNVQTASTHMLSAKVKAAPPVVQEAYQFAVDNPDIVSKFPCYCGCGGMGHKSNLDCFVKQFNADGSVVFDDHALGCGICVDIARDVERLNEAGKPLVEIRSYIDGQYSQFGTPTDTEPISG